MKCVLQFATIMVLLAVFLFSCGKPELVMTNKKINRSSHWLHSDMKVERVNDCFGTEKRIREKFFENSKRYDPVIGTINYGKYHFKIRNNLKTDMVRSYFEIWNREQNKLLYKTYFGAFYKSHRFYDIDSDGKDELILDFSEAYGVGDAGQEKSLLFDYKFGYKPVSVFNDLKIVKAEGYPPLIRISDFMFPQRIRMDVIYYVSYKNGKFKKETQYQDAEYKKFLDSNILTSPCIYYTNFDIRTKRTDICSDDLNTIYVLNVLLNARLNNLVAEGRRWYYNVYPYKETRERLSDSLEIKLNLLAKEYGNGYCSAPYINGISENDFK